ncbi:MAG: HAD family hydrolase [Chloroflexia bacterium]|nr:HAD family hydrolase [Chloroflexia bacterium]
MLVFDLDDTLYPEREYALSGFSAVDRWLQSEHGVVGFENKAVSIFHAGPHGRIFDVALSELGVAEDSALISQMVDIFRGHVPSITLHPDARWALDHFGSRMDLGLLTDGFLQAQRQKVAALKIAHLFSTMVYSDEMGREHWKPSETPYRTLMRQSGHSDSNHVYVSDNPAKDFIGARRLGWFTIRIRRPQGVYADLEAKDGYDADAEISTLRALEAVIPAANTQSFRGQWSCS